MFNKPDKNNSSNIPLVGALRKLFFGHLLNSSKDDRVLSTMLDAAVNASIGAMKEAQERGVDVYGEQDGWLVKIAPDGTLERIHPLGNVRMKITSREYNLKKSE
jgi:hypothetical protein